MKLFDKLKKIKGIDALKNVLNFVPGGNSIKAGIETLEKTIKQTKSQKVQEKDKPLEVVTSEKPSNAGLIYLVVGAGILYFLVK